MTSGNHPEDKAGRRSAHNTAATLSTPSTPTGRNDMHPIIPQPAPILPDRITRITALAPEDATAGLLWLAMNFPAVCDTMLDKTEYDAIDDPDPGREPAPYCAECGSDIGIFLKYGLNWRHYYGSCRS